MPELPEVETVCRGIEPVVTGKRLTKVILNRKDLRFPFPHQFAENLSGSVVTSVYRRAKYIVMDLSNTYSCLIHLGMSGRMLINPDDVSKHDHVKFCFEDAEIIYRDPRRFGYMALENTDTLMTSKYLMNTGVEPLSDALTPQYLYDCMSKSSMPIKNFLLNQKYIVGLGNIYVCEALYMCGIHPHSLSKIIPRSKIESLIPAIQDVLKKAIKAGGSSLRDHRQADGKLGYFQHNFSVYGREGESCKQCEPDAKIMRVVQSGRSSFYCHSCQKLFA